MSCGEIKSKSSQEDKLETMGANRRHSYEFSVSLDLKSITSPIKGFPDEASNYRLFICKMGQTLSPVKASRIHTNKAPGQKLSEIAFLTH